MVDVLGWTIRPLWASIDDGRPAPPRLPGGVFSYERGTPAACTRPLPLRPCSETVPVGVHAYRGTFPIRKRPPPWDPPQTLGIGLR